MFKIKENLFFYFTLILLTIISFRSRGSDLIPAFIESYKFMNPDYLINKYNKKGMGLKGNVYELKLYSIKPIYKFGEIDEEKKREIKDYTFDENGNLIYKCVYDPYTPPDPYIEKESETIYTFSGDSVIVSIKGRRVDAREIYYSYDYDSNGHLKEIHTCKYVNGYLDENKESKITFNYSGNDYSGVYWKNIKDKITFNKIGNKFSYTSEAYGLKSETVLILNNNGKVIGNCSGQYKIEYNKEGDIISIKLFHRGSIIDSEEWEYLYDDKGNWVERKIYKTIGTKKLKTWLRREITYLTTDEIRKLKHKKTMEENEEEQRAFLKLK